MGFADWDDNNLPALPRDHDWRAETGNFDTIPVIDVGGIRSQILDDRRKVATEIRDACTRVGFFYIKNHGIPEHLTEGVFEFAEKFFKLPFEQKMEVYIDNSPNFKGYTPVGGSGKPGPDGKGNLNEAFEWGLDPKLDDDPNNQWEDPHMIGPNRWPREPAGFEQHLSAYYREVRGFCRLLVRVVALSLGLREDYFDSNITHPGCSTVIAHYPPQKDQEEARGLDAHTDSECPIRALEVANKAGQWISAPPMKGAFVVNVGDQLQALTNDLYVSTRHRVMNYTGQERYSVPFFFSPNYETVIRPIPELITGEHVAQYPVISAGKMYKDNMTALHRIASTIPEFTKYRTKSTTTNSQ